MRLARGIVLLGVAYALAGCGNSAHDDVRAKVEQFAHATAIMVLTPGGRISRYFYGIDFPPKDLRMGLVEASQGKIGNPIDAVLLYCYHYDPATGKYGAVIANILRLAAAATILILGGFIFIMLRLERSLSRRSLSRRAPGRATT